MDTSTISRKLDTLTAHLNKLSGKKQALLEQKKLWTDKVASAKSRQLLKDNIAAVFESLQSKAHARSVGDYEQLLSFMLEDVMPEEGQVLLSPEYTNSTTGLDVLLLKNGFKEDVLSANGGALTNIICAGLRFISLSKTNNRKILVLDEPDCWVKPQRVRPFFKVITDVSNHTGFQTIFISHNSYENFIDFTSVIELKKDYLPNQDEVAESEKKFKLSVYTHSKQKDWSDFSDDTVGIRGIELINVRQHEHTIIPFYPGANSLIGDNNVGKSTAIISAFRAICYGESDDSLIRHDQVQAIIKFYLEKNQVLVFDRKKARTPVVQYSLLDAHGNVLKQGRQPSKNCAPDWVQDLLGIAKVDEMDIQLGMQKNPVFLLNESATKRAKLLSVGSEASHLVHLMKIYEKLKDEDSLIIKQGEQVLAQLDQQLNSLNELDALHKGLFDTQMEFEDTLVTVEKQKDLFQKIQTLLTMKKNLGWLNLQNKTNILFSTLKPPVLDYEKIDTLAKTLLRLKKNPLIFQKFPLKPNYPAIDFNLQTMTFNIIEKIYVIKSKKLYSVSFPLKPVEPAFLPMQELIATRRKLKEGAKRWNFTSNLNTLTTKVPCLPVVSAPVEMAFLLKKLSTISKTMNDVQKQENAVLTEVTASKKALLDYCKHHLRGQCPTCNQPFPEQDFAN